MTRKEWLRKYYVGGDIRGLPGSDILLDETLEGAFTKVAFAVARFKYNFANSLGKTLFGKTPKMKEIYREAGECSIERQDKNGEAK